MDKLISEPGRNPVYMCDKCGVFHTSTHTCQEEDVKKYQLNLARLYIKKHGTPGELVFYRKFFKRRKSPVPIAP